MAGGRPFTKGRSGNPRGRPRGPSIAAAFRRRLKSRTGLDGEALDGRRTVLDVIVEAIVRGAATGDPKLARLLIERVDGRPAGNVDEADELAALKAEVAALRELIERGDGDGGGGNPGAAAPGRPAEGPGGAAV